jgi:transposase
MIDLIVPLQPLFNLLKDEVIDYPIASCDATTLQVLNEPNRNAETKSQLYCMRGGPPDKSVILYEYNALLHKVFVSNWFQGFSGYLHVDGGNCFDSLGAQADVQLSYCNAHARRKFEAVAKVGKKNGLAAEALRKYKALYKIEREAKEAQLTPEQRYARRQQDSKPVMEQFKQWLDKHWPTVLPQSPLGNAFAYAINRWEGLARFLDDGRLEIDNNHTEREIKPVVIARKNFLFCASVDGAKALSLHFSLLRTAKLHGHEPYRYYVRMLKSIPHCKTVADYEALLPWNMAVNSDE